MSNIEPTLDTIEDYDGQESKEKKRIIGSMQWIAKKY
jgi:hypothetical protein